MQSNYSTLTPRDGQDAGFEFARNLLQKARINFQQMTLIVQSNMIDDEPFGLHAHKAALRTLRAWIEFIKIEYPITDDIGVLLDVLHAQGCEVDGYAEWVDLNPFAYDLQYSNEGMPETPLDRSRIFKQVEALLIRVEKLVGLCEK